MSRRHAKVSLKPGQSRAALTITHPDAAGRGWPTGWPRAIEANRDSYSVTMMCDLLSVSRSGLHDAHGRKPSLRTVANTQIVKRMQCAQRKHRGCYGRRRMTPEMSEVLGRPVNQKRIGRLMRAHDLNSRKRRKFRVVTTDSKHAHPVAANVLERNFVADVPNQKWLADLTYVPTDEGWLFVALVLDLFARKIVGWAMSDTMPQELTLAALWVALGWRDPDPGLVHHSDRGSQYVASIQGLPPAANDYRAVLKARGIMVSMSVVIGQSRKSRRRNTVCLRCGKVECGAAEDRLGNGA